MKKKSLDFSNFVKKKKEIEVSFKNTDEDDVNFFKNISIFEEKPIKFFYFKL